MLPAPQDKPMATIKLPPPAVAPFSAKNLPPKPVADDKSLEVKDTPPTPRPAQPKAKTQEVKVLPLESPPSPPVLLPVKVLEEDLDAEMGEPVQEKVTGKGKKNPRFGRNPDGTTAAKAPKKEVVRKSPWGIWLHQYKEDHPDLYPAEATIEARKYYKAKNNKEKSFERLYTEVWKQRNPRWPKMAKEERAAAIRADFLKAI